MLTLTNEPIPAHILEAAGRALRFQVLSLLNITLANSGLPPALVAKRLGWRTKRLQRALAGDFDLGLREIAEVFWAIDGSLLKLSLTPKERYDYPVTVEDQPKPEEVPDGQPS